MGDGTRLVKTMTTIASSRSNSSMSTDFVMGTVISTNPIIIQVGGLNLTSDFLMLSPFCVETKIDLKHSHNLSGETASTDLGSHSHVIGDNSSNTTQSTNLGSHKHKINLNSVEGLDIITLWRGLKKNDKVLMLRGASGQKYYVLQRQEGLGQ